MKCNYCESKNIVKNGTNRVGTPKYKCKDSLRQFVENPKNKIITEYEKERIDKLLLEKLSLAGIKYIRAMDTNTVNNKFKNIEQTIKVSAKTDLDLIIECDELCTFVKKRE